MAKDCPNNYTSPNHSEWSDPEEVEDLNKEREKEKEPKMKESKEKEKEQNITQKELKQRPITTSYYLPGPQYIPSYESDTFTPVLTNTLVLPPSPEKMSGITEHRRIERRRRKTKRRMG